jgi:N-acetylglucosaminyldiphosphoundecaprenol N-acetyl-beta-D-mannosaminyltransferase
VLIFVAKILLRIKNSFALKKWGEFIDRHYKVMEYNNKPTISVAMDELFSKIWPYPLELGKSLSAKMSINTLNAHSFICALADPDFYNALLKSDILLPDGVGITLGIRYLYKKRITKIAGYDLFEHEMRNLQESNGKCFFLGSSANVLNLIVKRANIDYPHVKIGVYAPPYESEFTKEQNELMINAVNAFSPDVLFIGMTAPKQEKWAYSHINELNARHICSIGAVFNFYAGTRKRAPKWMINNGLEWFFRLITEPRRMWKRYLLNNFRFIVLVIKEKYKMKSQRPEKCN